MASSYSVDSSIRHWVLFESLVGVIYSYLTGDFSVLLGDFNALMGNDNNT